MHTIRWEKHNPDMSSAKCISVEGVNGGVGSEIGQRYLSFDDSCKWSIGDVGNGQDCQKFQLNNNSFNYEVFLRRNLNNIRVKRTAVFNKEEIKAENTFMYRHVKSVEISSLVGDIDSNAFDGWNISSVVCPLKWLKRFDLSKLEYIGILSNSSETDVVNITKEDFEKCSNLKHLNIYFRNFDDNSDLLEKLKMVL